MPITSPASRSVLAAGRVQAPFEMPAIAIPDFSASRRFPITDFGADRNQQGLTSAAIAAAIAAASASTSAMPRWPRPSSSARSRAKPGCRWDVRLRGLQVLQLGGAPVMIENVEGFVYDADQKERA